MSSIIVELNMFQIREGNKDSQDSWIIRGSVCADAEGKVLVRIQKFDIENGGEKEVEGKRIDVPLEFFDPVFHDIRQIDQVNCNTNKS